MKRALILVAANFVFLSSLLTQPPPSRWSRFKLENGLVFFLQEDHTTSMVSHHIFVHTGARNERPGITDISHLIEHLRWGGNPGEEPFEKKMQVLGGSTGGHTFPDFTDYIDTAPNHALELMIESGADFIGGLRTQQDRFKAERDVILSEALLAENNANYVAIRHLFAAAFQAHPYKNPVGGWRSDAAEITLEDVKTYFQTYYTPRNTTIFLAGDFETDAVIALMKKNYGRIPSGPEVPRLRTIEPPQNAEKTVRFFAPVSQSSVWVGYHVPGIAHEDVPALQVMYALLCNGRSARLKKVLVEDKKIAHRINPYGAETRQWRKDPSLLVFGLAVDSAFSAVEAEVALTTEIEKLSRESVSQMELDRAVKRERTDRLSYIIYTVWTLWSVGSRTEQAGFYHALTGDPDYGHKLAEAYKRVSVEDVRRVARKYLKPSNRTSVLMVPKSESSADMGEER